MKYALAMLALVSSMIPSIANGFLLNGRLTCRRIRTFVVTNFDVIGRREVTWDCRCNTKRDNEVEMACLADATTIKASIVVVSDRQTLRFFYSDKDDLFEDIDAEITFERQGANRNVNNWTATGCAVQVDGNQCTTCTASGTFGGDPPDLDFSGNCRTMDSNKDEEKEDKPEGLMGKLK